MNLTRAAGISCCLAAVSAGSSAAQVLTPQTSNTTEALIGLHPVSDRVVWASGSGGTFLRTTDGGAHWTAGTVPGAEAVQFRDVHALDSLTAWLLSIPSGDSARIYHTTDGGAHWTLQFQNHDPAAFYDCFAFWDTRHAIAISDAVRGHIPILLTEDGGEHWSLLPNAPGTAADSGEGSPAASGTCVVAKGAGHAWLGTTGGKQGARVLRSIDGGRTWQAAHTPIGTGTTGAGIFSLVFRDQLHGFAAGSEDSTRVPTQRLAAPAAGGPPGKHIAEPSINGTIYGMALVPGRPLLLVATGPGGASISMDNAHSWRPLDSGNFWTVEFATSHTGWMIGPRGRIARIDLR